MNIKKTSLKILGVDIGGVIIDRINDGTDTSFFSENYLNSKAVPGAFESLRELVGGPFGDRVHLVSKCGPRTQKKTLEWLHHHNFHFHTGIRPPHVHFCLERHEKAGICERLEITHFVDDSLEVLSNLTAVQTRYLFNSHIDKMSRRPQSLSWVIGVDSWQRILDREIPRR